MRLSIRYMLTVIIIFMALINGCESETDRTTALETIARWEDQRLSDTDSLIAMIDHNDAHIRRAACRAAGLIGRTETGTECELKTPIGRPRHGIDRNVHRESAHRCRHEIRSSV